MSGFDYSSNESYTEQLLDQMRSRWKYWTILIVVLLLSYLNTSVSFRCFFTSITQIWPHWSTINPWRRERKSHWKLEEKYLCFEVFLHIDQWISPNFTEMKWLIKYCVWMLVVFKFSRRWKSSLFLVHEKDSRSFIKHMKHLSSLFLQIRFPSTTTRLPRDLSKYKEFKANELRILLLFGHIIFAEVLGEVYYSHLLQLVVLMHMAESREIQPNQVSIIEQLSNSFVIDFAKLYTPRHCVPVVYSIVHIPQTVKDFGPLTNFTTFTFEDILGKISDTQFFSRSDLKIIFIILNLQSLDLS